MYAAGIVLATSSSCYLHHWRWRRLCFHPFLSVSLCPWYLKKMSTDSYETWWSCLVCYMEEMIQFWGRSMSGTGPDNIFKWFIIIERLGETILHDISKRCWRTRMKLGGQNGCVSGTNCFDFDEDLGPHPTTRIFKVILHHWEIRLKNDI